MEDDVSVVTDQMAGFFTNHDRIMDVSKFCLGWDLLLDRALKVLPIVPVNPPASQPVRWRMPLGRDGNG
jgi:hypothetical protein